MRVKVKKAFSLGKDYGIFYPGIQNLSGCSRDALLSLCRQGYVEMPDEKPKKPAVIFNSADKADKKEVKKVQEGEEHNG